MSVLIGIDVGGTFTDFSCFDTDRGELFYYKVSSTPDDPSRAIVNGVKELLEQQDIEVVMTREEDRGLYDENASNKKAQDMKRRCELINEEQPACVVSIHQNSYHEEAICGAQVFYYGTSKESQGLAELIQEELVRFVDPENHRQAKANDTYYLLKKTQAPVVIVEYCVSDRQTDL